MPRLFTALEIPPSIREELWALRGGLSGARWVAPEDYHLTICFVGDVNDGTAYDFRTELARIRIPNLRIVLDRLDVFGGDQPRALVAAARLSPELGQLRRDHESAARRAAAGTDGRKFIPHVTLARLRRASAAEAADFIVSRGFFEPKTFLAENFVLYSAKPSTGGGPYLREAIFSKA